MLWIYIGFFRGACSVSSFCDFRKITFCDFTAFSPLFYTIKHRSEEVISSFEAQCTLRPIENWKSLVRPGVNTCRCWHTWGTLLITRKSMYTLGFPAGNGGPMFVYPGGVWHFAGNWGQILFFPNRIMNNRHKVFAQQGVCYALMTFVHATRRVFPVWMGRKKIDFWIAIQIASTCTVNSA